MLPDPEVVYLGHKITKEGLQPTDGKVRAVKEFPTPANVSKLRSLLSQYSYNSKFLPNMSANLAPLYALLQKNNNWEWSSKQKRDFQAAKDALLSDSVLVHFDPNKELVLTCDTSSYGVGAVLAHKMEDGSEKPIAFLSRTRAPAERNYSQVEKGLAIVYGVKKMSLLSLWASLYHSFRSPATATLVR